MPKSDNKALILAAIADGPKTRDELLELVPGLSLRSLGQLGRSLDREKLARWRWRDGVECLDLPRRTGIKAGPPPGEPVAEADKPPPAEFAVWNDGALYIKRGEEAFSLYPEEVHALWHFLAQTRVVPVPAHWAQRPNPPSLPAAADAVGDDSRSSHAD